MYELNSAWEQYYEELNPDKRRRLFAKIREEAEDDGADTFRAQLYKARHTDPYQGTRKVDMFMQAFLILPTFYREKGKVKSAEQKNVLRALEPFQLDGLEKRSEAEKAALYWEIRNAARRYLETCKSSGYGAKLFGLMKSNEDTRKDRSCREIWTTARGVAQRFEMEKEMKIFSDAVIAEYALFDDDALARFQAYDRAQRIK